MEFSDDELKRFAEQMREQTKRRQQMRAALKAVVTPVLRKRGFTGSCPHFRRLGNQRHDLLTFYFDKYGDSFVIDLGQRLSDWVPAPGRIYPPPHKITPWDLEACERARVQPGPFINQKTSWFHYDKAETPADYARIAESVVPLVEQALTMFDDFQHVPKIDQAV